MSPTSKKKTKTSASKKRKTGSFKLVPFRENMGTGESYVPKRRTTRRPSRERTKSERPNPLDRFEALELEERSRNFPAVLLIPGESFLGKLLRTVISYGLWIFLVLAMSTSLAWYVHEMSSSEHVRMVGRGNEVVFIVGGADAQCRLIVETSPISSALEVNGTPILSRTPVRLMLPCEKSATLSFREPGFISTARIIRPEDKATLKVALSHGVSTMTDELKFNFINSLRPILSAFGW